MSHASRGLSAETVFAVADSARSYVAARGRTQLRAVVPSCARSYLREGLRYDRTTPSTTARSSRVVSPQHENRVRRIVLRSGAQPGILSCRRWSQRARVGVKEQRSSTWQIA